MNRRTFLTTLFGAGTAATTADWQTLRHSTGDPTANTTGTDPLEALLVHATDLAEGYEPRHPEPVLGTDDVDERLIDRRSVQRSVPWDSKQWLAYTEARTRAAASTDGPSDSPDAGPEHATFERAMFKSQVLTPALDTTTPADLHQLLVWRSFDGSQPGFEHHTEWVDTEYAEQDAPYPRTDIMCRTPVLTRPPEAPTGESKPKSERATVVATTDWGAIRLLFELAYAPEQGQTLAAIRPLADRLQQRATQLPAPDIDTEFETTTEKSAANE